MPLELFVRFLRRYCKDLKALCVNSFLILFLNSFDGILEIRIAFAFSKTSLGLAADPVDPVNPVNPVDWTASCLIRFLRSAWKMYL